MNSIIKNHTIVLTNTFYKILNVLSEWFFSRTCGIVEKEMIKLSISYLEWSYMRYIFFNFEILCLFVIFSMFQFCKIVIILKNESTSIVRIKEKSRFLKWNSFDPIKGNMNNIRYCRSLVFHRIRWLTI